MNDMVCPPTFEITSSHSIRATGTAEVSSISSNASSTTRLVASHKPDPPARGASASDLGGVRKGELGKEIRWVWGWVN